MIWSLWVMPSCPCTSWLYRPSYQKTQDLCELSCGYTHNLCLCALPFWEHKVEFFSAYGRETASAFRSQYFVAHPGSSWSFFRLLSVTRSELPSRKLWQTYFSGAVALSISKFKTGSMEPSWATKWVEHLECNLSFQIGVCLSNPQMVWEDYIKQICKHRRKSKYVNVSFCNEE